MGWGGVVHVAGVGIQVNIPRTVAVYLPHAGRVADQDLLCPAGHGLQRRNAEPLVQGREQKRPAVGHQAFGFAIADIAQVDYVGQVGQTQAPGFLGQAAAARDSKHCIGLGLGGPQHPGEVLVFQQVRHAEIVPALLQLRVPGKHAVIGRDALHLLPGVVDNIHFFQRHTVVFVDLRLGKFRYRNNALGLLGNAAVLQAVPRGAQPVAAGVPIKILPGAVADIVHHRNTGKPEPRDDVAGSQPLGAALFQVARVVQLLPGKALAGAERHNFYVGVCGRFDPLRHNDLHQPRRDDGIQRGQKLNGVALDARDSLGKKRAIHGPDGLLHGSLPYAQNCAFIRKILLTLRSSRSSLRAPFCTAASTAS